MGQVIGERGCYMAKMNKVRMPWMRANDAPLNKRMLCYGLLEHMTGMFFATRTLRNAHGLHR